MSPWVWLAWVTVIAVVLVLAYWGMRRPRRDDFQSVTDERQRLRELGRAAGWRS